MNIILAIETLLVVVVAGTMFRIPFFARCRKPSSATNER